MPAAATRRLATLAMPPGAELATALERAWAAGDAVMPLDPTAPRAVTARLVAAMQPDVPVDEAVALVIPTSGSSGEPKGVQLSRAALEASARATHARIGLEPGDRWLSCLPWHHIAGLQVMLRARLLGIPLEVHERFDVDRFAAEPATLTSLVPTQLARLLDAGVDLTRFRVVLLGGGAAAPSLLGKAARAGVPIVTTYGMTETCGGCVYDGLPLDGVDVRVGPDRRVRLRGPMLMEGYRLRPDLDAAAFEGGWFVTSDLGEYSGGRLRVTGRADDVIVTGGENVDAAQVAGVLAEHPSLADVAVVGVEDAEWGQRVVAVVVVTAGANAPTAQELRRWSGQRLDPPARPRQVVAVGRIPMLASGKPDRLAIRRLAADA